jgi:hypothetical protein
MVRERCCGWCGNVFEIERKRGRPRIYCPNCSPPGYQVIRRRGRFKLRLRPALFPRVPKGGWARVSSIMRKDIGYG